MSQVYLINIPVIAAFIIALVTAEAGWVWYQIAASCIVAFVTVLLMWWYSPMPNESVFATNDVDDEQIEKLTGAGFWGFKRND